MNPRLILAAGSAIAILSLAGCGLSGTVSATPQGNGTYKITGHATPSPSKTPAASAPVSSSASQAPARNAGEPSTPSPAPAAIRSTSATVPSSSAGTAATASPFNAVVQQALEDIHGQTPLPLQGPRVIPETAYAPAGGYLTAQTTVGHSHWTVNLRDTLQPEPVNSSAISDALSATPYVGSFGIQQLSGNAVGTNALDETTLRQFNPLWYGNQGIMNATGKETLVVGGQHAALTATAYGFARSYNDAKLTWQEGKWTVEVTGGSPRYEQDMAYDLVDYLHTQYLPPYPGLIMIRLIHEGPSYANTAITHIDWIDGRYLMHLDTRVPSPANPVAAAAMAVSWHPF